MATQTATMRLSKPTTGSDQAPLWGNYLDADMDLIDRAVNQTITINIPDANVTPVADGTTNDVALYQAYSFTGSQSANRTVTIPNVSRFGRAQNLTTGGLSVILSTGVGSNALVPPSGLFYKYWVDSSGDVNLLAPEQNGFLTSVQASAVNFPNNTPKDVTSLSLYPGDWDVSGAIAFSPTSGAPNANNIQGWINTASASAPTAQYLRTILTINGEFLTTSFAVPPQRLLLSVTTTVFLSGAIGFTTGAFNITGYMNARLAG